MDTAANNTATPIKFGSAKEAGEYFRALGFSPWDAHYLAFALYTPAWGKNRAEQVATADRKLREEFPGLSQAAQHYTTSGQEAADNENDLTGTDLDLGPDWAGGAA